MKERIIEVRVSEEIYQLLRTTGWVLGPHHTTVHYDPWRKSLIFSTAEGDQRAD